MYAKIAEIKITESLNFRIILGCTEKYRVFLIGAMRCILSYVESHREETESHRGDASSVVSFGAVI